jgi:HSP20 family protein
MTLVRWDPFRNVAALQDRINRVFDDSISHFGDGQDELAACAWRPVVDIYETDDGIVIQAEIPGVRKEDLSVELKDNVLTLKGRRFAEQEVEPDRYLRRERCFGSFYRAFTLQETVPPDAIKARFRDGVLEVRVPRPERHKPRQVAVEVEE